MHQRHLSPFRKRTRQFLGQPVYTRTPDRAAAGHVPGVVPDPGRPDKPPRSVLAIAYTGVRRPCVCTGCICLTPTERARQKRVFALARAYAAAASRIHQQRA